MTESAEDRPVDTAAVDPDQHSRGTGADTAQTSGERDHAVHDFDDHADADAPTTLDGSEAAGQDLSSDTGADLPEPTEIHTDDKQTRRQE